MMASSGEPLTTLSDAMTIILQPLPLFQEEPELSVETILQTGCCMTGYRAQPNEYSALQGKFNQQWELAHASAHMVF
jgi:hypothetical protein